MLSVTTLADHTLELATPKGSPPRACVMPDNPAALDSLGWVHFRCRRRQGRISTLEHAYASATTPEIAAHWGEALWVSGKRGEARRVWAAGWPRARFQTTEGTLKRFLPDAQ